MEPKITAKKITLFLLDGYSTGRISCELSNWNGKAYKIPRSLLKHCGERSDLSGIGIYLLFGRGLLLGRDNDLLLSRTSNLLGKSSNLLLAQNHEKSETDIVYIGETEEVFKRLTKHYGEKEFWNEAVVITSKDGNLNKAHIKFLERKMYEKAVAAGRYQVANGNKPASSNISEADAAEMEEFFANVQLLVSTLGYKVFENIRPAEPVGGSSDNPIFYIKAAHGAEAQGQITPEGFVVFANSRIAHTITPSCPQVTIAMRARLFEEKIISGGEKNEQYFAKDYLFSSSSAAAQIVLGRSANGLQEWKTCENMTLKQFGTPK